MGEKGARLSSSSEDFKETVVARLAPIGGITSRKMFGGFGIFHDDQMFAIISKEKLFFKVGPSNLPDYKAAGSSQHRPMPYYEVPDEVYGRAVSFKHWARKSIEVAHTAPAKSSKKK